MRFLQATDRRQAALLDLVEPRNRAYCERLGIEYRAVRSDSVNGFGVKNAAVVDTLSDMGPDDVLAWVDNDAFIMPLGMDSDIRTALGVNYELALAKYAGIRAQMLPYFYNDGVVLMRATDAIKNLWATVIARQNRFLSEPTINSLLAGLDFQELDPKWNFIDQPGCTEQTCFIQGFHGTNPQWVLNHFTELCNVSID